eukprot:9336680-Pyramimonas_sp.AAC.1
MARGEAAAAGLPASARRPERDDGEKRVGAPLAGSLSNVASGFPDYLSGVARAAFQPEFKDLFHP